MNSTVCVSGFYSVLFSLSLELDFISSALFKNNMKFYQNDNNIITDALIAPKIVYSYDNTKSNVQLTQVFRYEDCTRCCLLFCN